MNVNDRSLKSTPNIRKDIVTGSRRVSNYWWASVITLGASGFFLAGVSSYLNQNLLPIANPTELSFLPQGVVMTFYGVIGLLISIYLWLTIILDIGGGYNEFNLEEGKVVIFRWGFPGENRKICITYPIKEIQSIKVYIKEGFNPKREIYLKTKDNKEIPLTRVGQPMLLSELEEEAAELAQFLGVVLEGM